MHNSDPLIHTKLCLPFIRLSRVTRPRLQEQLLQGLRGPLTLIIAPAGFGKTTLAAACVTGHGMPVAWLSLDKNDNQVERFLEYLIAALHKADETIGNDAAQLMAEMHQVSPEAVLTSLINGLEITGRELILVLDDYQFINSQAVHQAVGFLLEHCPHTLHMVIATRADPPLRLARLRARGQMVEFRAADLRFTAAEAAQFLNDIMGLSLDAGSVAVLEERTEGWVAGLQMAALSLRDRKDVTSFIEKFSGTNRYILDYLLEEVLAGQPSDVQRFLLYTSILERLTAPLCDALLQDEPGEASSVTLDYLDRANLFLVPLDDKRAWYRYHHLFADLLRTRLSQIRRDLTPQLHLRAAAWLEHEGMTVEAINHTLSAGEYDRAARLVEENTTRLLAQGELNALMSWIEMLPVDLRVARPWLCVHQAYALIFAGRYVEIGPLLAQAESVLEAESAQETTSRNGQPDQSYALSMDMADVRTLKGALVAVRAFDTAIRVQDAEALAQAQQARDLLAPGDLFDQSLVAFALGYILHSQGQLAEAYSAFEEQIRLSRILQNDATLMIGSTALARVLADQGRLKQARDLLEKSLAEAHQKRVRNQGFIARTEAHLGALLCEQNELEAAHHLLSNALTHSRYWLNPNHVASIYVYLARVQLARGDLQAAWTTICEADRIRRKAQLSPWIENSLDAEIVRMWLALRSGGMELVASDPLAEGSRLILDSWRRELADRAECWDSHIDPRMEMISFTLGRESLLSGHIDETLSLLEPLAHHAKAAGHTAAAIGSLILTALAHQKKGASARGPMLTALEEALSLAEPGGYARVFLNEGAPMQTMLAQWVAQVGTSPLRDYAVQLLSQFDVEMHAVMAAPEKVSPAGNLVEPLSPRELEVLHLMALGRTNQEIAEQLIVAAGTVKAHAASIYRKLEAANRTEAVNRARELGLLP